MTSTHLLSAIIMAESASMLLIGLVVLLRNWRAKVNRLFFSTAALAGIWITVAYFGGRVSSHPEVSIGLVKADYLIGPWLIYALRQFAVSLLEERTSSTEVHPMSMRPSSFLLGLIALGASCASLDRTVLTIEGVAGQQVVEQSKFVPLYLLPLVFLLSIAASNLILLVGKMSQDWHKKFMLLVFSVLMPTVLAGVQFIIIDGSFSDPNAARTGRTIGYLSFLTFVGLSGLTIARYNLFGVHASIMRSVGYFLLLGLIGLLCVGVALALANITLLGF